MTGTEHSSLYEHTSYQSPELECDVIMKGGVTSGVVYPRAVCRIAQRFRLRSVGGTSAGAIAAACAAAAELGRESETGGFSSFAKLPTELGEKDGNGTSRLFGLFQPTPETRPLFAVFMASLRKTGKVWRVPWTLVRHGGWWALLGALPGLLGLFVSGFGSALSSGELLAAFLGIIVLGAGFVFLGPRVPERRQLLVAVAAIVVATAVTIAALRLCACGRYAAPMLFQASFVTAIVGALIGAAWRCYLIVFEDLPQQNFGVCTGGRSDGSPAPALADWMHARIQQLAGRDADAPPVTFGDLKKRDVDLQIMTTCLTHGRPYQLPKLRRTFYFCEKEMRRLFPDAIVDHLVQCARTIVEKDRSLVDRSIRHACMRPRLPLPRGDALPIVVAARMSLSFPVLLSAVSLWDYDWHRPHPDAPNANYGRLEAWRKWAKENPDAWKRLLDDARDVPADAPPPVVPERIWFSDGGISTNFPIHLFDSPVPSRPTLGISLNYHGADVRLGQNRVELAGTHGDGIEEHWTRFGSVGDDGAGSLPRFILSIFSAMQNWMDTTLVKMPGYRDRVAHLHLAKAEGGLNLDMSETLINELAGYGEAAGDRLRERFEQVDGEGAELTWTNHRWVRFRTTLAAFESWLDEFAGGANTNEPTFDDLIRRDADAHPTSYPLKNQSEIFTLALQHLRELSLTMPKNPPDNDEAEYVDRGPPVSQGAPRPRPLLRLFPPLD